MKVSESFFLFEIFFQIASSLDTMPIHDFTGFFTGDWDLVSCTDNYKEVKEILKADQMVRVIQDNKSVVNIADLNHRSILWKFNTCPEAFNLDLLKSINNSEIPRLWIIVHENEGTIFPADLHQNIIHFVRQNEKFLEWKKHGKFIDKLENVGVLSQGLQRRILVDDLMGTRFRVLTEYDMPQAGIRKIGERGFVTTESGDKLIPLNIHEDVYGTYIDVLKEMKAQFNITVDLYTR